MDQRPGEGDPLLLAGRQLVGPVLLAVGQVDGREHLADRRRLLAAPGVPAGDDERQGDVLAHRQDREQVEELEDEARLVAAQLRRGVVAELAHDRPVEHDLAGGRAVQPAEEVQERALAGARRSHDGHELARLDRQRDAPDGGDVDAAHAVAPGEVARLEDGRHQAAPQVGTVPGRTAAGRV